MKSSSSRRYLSRTGCPALSTPLPAPLLPHPALGSGQAAAPRLHSTDNAPMAARPGLYLEAQGSSNQPPTVRPSAEPASCGNDGCIITPRSRYHQQHLDQPQPVPVPTKPMPGQCCCTRSGWMWRESAVETFISCRKQHRESHSFPSPSGNPAHAPGHILHIQPSFCVVLLNLPKTITF